jgi:hypothetical protein
MQCCGQAIGYQAIYIGYDQGAADVHAYEVIMKDLCDFCCETGSL